MKPALYSQIYHVEQTHWWYVARRKIVFEWIFRLLAGCPAPRVLDAGCGTGFNIEYLHQSGYDEVVGLDLSPVALEFCRSRGLGCLVCGDGANVPLKEGLFDLILALDLIEHLGDDRRALQEFARLLKAGGALVLLVPAFNFLWGLQDEVSYHYRRYTAGDLAGKLEAAGLNIAKLTYLNMFLSPLILAGRVGMRVFGNSIHATSENALHPRWSNGLLQAIFSAERLLIRRTNLPFGVSLFCVATKGEARPSRPLPAPIAAAERDLP
jgi:SAM-dependent methyltransferase